jgi:hypothetical protein
VLVVLAMISSGLAGLGVAAGVEAAGAAGGFAAGDVAAGAEQASILAAKPTSINMLNRQNSIFLVIFISSLFN